jgi:RNase P subunit RPR2
MREIPSTKRAEINPSVWVRQCPKCDPPHVMNIKTIRSAMFGGYDLIIYECRECGAEKIEQMK